MKKVLIFIFSTILVMFLLPLTNIHASEGLVDSKPLTFELTNLKVDNNNYTNLTISINNNSTNKYVYGTDKQKGLIKISTNNATVTQELNKEIIETGFSEFNLSIKLNGKIDTIEFLNIFELDHNLNVIETSCKNFNCNVNKYIQGGNNLDTKDLITARVKNKVSFIKFHIITLTIDVKDNYAYRFTEDSLIEVVTDTHTVNKIIETGGILTGQFDYTFYLPFEGNIQSITLKNVENYSQADSVKDCNLAVKCDINNNYKDYDGFFALGAGVLALLVVTIILRTMALRRTNFGILIGSSIRNVGIIVLAFGILVYTNMPLEQQSGFIMAQKVSTASMAIGAIIIFIGFIFNVVCRPKYRLFSKY